MQVAVGGVVGLGASEVLAMSFHPCRDELCLAVAGAHGYELIEADAISGHVIARTPLMRRLRHLWHQLSGTDAAVLILAYDCGDIEYDEYAIYNMWFDEFVRDLPVAGLVYIRADPETCMQRITKRGREGETIPLEYVQKCHDYHENWINGITCKKLVIDANAEIEDTAHHRVQEIVAFINQLSPLSQ